MEFIAQFRARVLTFILDNQMSDSGFGRLVLRDPNFVKDLRAGRSPGEKVIQKVENYMKTRNRLGV